MQPPKKDLIEILSKPIWQFIGVITTILALPISLYNVPNTQRVIFSAVYTLCFDGFFIIILFLRIRSRGGKVSWKEDGLIAVLCLVVLLLFLLPVFPFLTNVVVASGTATPTPSGIIRTSPTTVVIPTATILSTPTHIPTEGPTVTPKPTLVPATSPSPSPTLVVTSPAQQTIQQFCTFVKAQNAQGAFSLLTQRVQQIYKGNSQSFWKSFQEYGQCTPSPCTSSGTTAYCPVTLKSSMHPFCQDDFTLVQSASNWKIDDWQSVGSTCN